MRVTCRGNSDWRTLASLESRYKQMWIKGAERYDDLKLVVMKVR